MLTAHDFAATPENYNRLAKIGKHTWECTGYSRTGMTVRFSRLVETSKFKLRQVNIYVNPDKMITIVED